jgi:hypothetical protein
VRPQSASATSSSSANHRSLVQDMLLQTQANTNEFTSLNGPSLAELANRQLFSSTNPVDANADTAKKIEEPVQEIKLPIVPKSALFKVGDRIQGRFRGGNEWYDANIKNILDDNLYHVVYDDGDEETGVSEDKIRKKEISKDIKVNISNTNTTTNTNTNRSNTPVSITGKFKVGDKIEAQYYNGTTWYEGKIAGLTSDGDIVKYDIIYSDGDREKAVSEDKIRSLAVVETVTPKVPAISLSMPDTNTSTISTANNKSTGSNKENPQNDNKNDDKNDNKNDDKNDDKNFSKYLDDLSDDEDNGLLSGRGVYGAVDDDMNNDTGEGNYDEDFDA